MSTESKGFARQERDRTIREDRSFRDSKPPAIRDNKPVRDNVTNRADPHSVRCRVFIGNLPTDKMSRQEMEDVFSHHGKVAGVSIHTHFGFVQYENERSADEAVSKENGKVYYGKRLGEYTCVLLLELNTKGRLHKQ